MFLQDHFNPRRRRGATLATFSLAFLLAGAAPWPASAETRARTVGVNGTIRVTSPEEAVAAALRRSPVLGAAEAGVAASRGNLTQAGLLPNPALGLSAENIGGSGRYRGTEAAETTYQLAQRLEVGGQRGARVGVARTEVTLAGRDLVAIRLDVVRAARQAYAEATAARRATRIAAEGVRLAEEVLRAARERVSAGREPLLQQRRAEVSLSTARIARSRAEREAEVAQRALAVVLAASEVELGPSDRWFDDIGPDPAGRAPLDPVGNPDFVRWRDEVARADAILDLERRRAIPDVTVGAGLRRFADSRDTAVVLNLSVPLPVFDRNQGNIARAGADRTRTERVAELNQRALTASLTDAGQRLTTAWREAEGLRRVVVPGAEQAFGFAREGYAAGRFSFLEVLDAQRTLLEARTQLNAALRDVHLRRAESDRLSGGPALPDVPSLTGGRP
ncbi:TolC family protein [Roseicella aerolata]|uniref:TolC family protein n=1 Tax=Roseicella aerolata TaxID=2883479 RepID=A0A9X1IJJ4_9PROT|nr:TolC family protein [Roseicella aerolata]MCB4824548.1 TolC family protein [Roseicella aerolata]